MNNGVLINFMKQGYIAYQNKGELNILKIRDVPEYDRPIAFDDKFIEKDMRNEICQ